MSGVTDFIITFGPSLLFLFIVILSTIVGLIRGFRKSTILAIQALIAFVVCIIIFIVLARSKNTDSNLVNIANTFLGEGGLQRRLNVSESSKTMTDILIEYIPKQMNYGDGIRLILAENGQYLRELVFLAYRLILAVISCFIYLLLVFIFYLIYVIFYPERRHKRKVMDKANRLESEKTYKKRPIFGMLIGLGRGLVSSIIILAFFGSFLYMVAGTGKNKYKNDEVSFGNQEYDNYYSLYTSIGSYGTTGVYKVLNSITVKDNMPFYLYAVDLVFSGNLNDTNRGVNTKFNFADEIGTYTNFARQTIDLLMKYGKDEIIEVLNDNTNGDMLGTILLVMGKPGFQEEYNRVIDDFNAKTFFVNFTLSLIDSIVAHIDELKIEGNSDAFDAISLLFKKDYLSPYIPEEKEILDRLEENPNYEYETRPYITASSLLTKDDAKSLLKSLVASFGLDTKDQDNTEKILTYSTGIIPSLSELSIFSDKRKEEMNGVLERMYVYLDNRYIETALKTEDTNTGNGEYLTMKQLNAAADGLNVDWTSEIKSLLNTAVDAVDIYKSVYVKGEEPLNMVTNILNPNNPKASSNEEKLDSIINRIADSKLLDKVLSSKGMAKTLENAFKSIASDVYVPQLSYANKYNADGTLIEYGETYNALNGAKAILKNEDLCEQLKNIKDLTNTEDPIQMATFIKDFAVNLTTKDSDNQSIANKLLESDLLRSVLSGVIISHKTLSAENGIELYIPNEVLDLVDNEPVNMIQKTELNDLVNKLGDLIDVVIPYIDESSDRYNKINPIVNDDRILGLLENHVVNGTLVGVIVNLSNNEQTKDIIVLPKSYEDGGIEAWIEARELQNLIDGIRNAAINFDTLINTSYPTEEDREDAIIDEIRTINKDSVEGLLESKVLHYTISKFLASSDLGGLQLVVPKSTRQELTNDNLEYLIYSSEIADLINNINVIVPTDMDNTTELFKNIVNGKEQLFNSDIILTTVVNYIVNDTSSGINEVIYISDDYKENATLETLINITPTNIWRDEMPLLLDGIDVLLDLSNDPTIDLTDKDSLSDKVMANVKTLNESYQEGTKLDVCYKSHVLVTTLSEKIAGDDVSVRVPTDALSDIEYSLNSVVKHEIQKIEVSRLIDVLNELDIDVTDASFSKVILNNTDILAVSKIFRATINQNLEGKDIIVPYEANENGYISEAEMRVFLKDLKDNQTIFFGSPDESGKIDITNPEVDASNINVSVLQTLVDSKIFYATIINQVTVIDNASVEIPSYHDAIGQREYLEQNNLSDNLWYTTNEVNHLLDALELIIGSDSAINGISDAIIIEKLKTLTDDNINMIYDSTIIKASISKALNTNLEDEMNLAVRDSNLVKYYDLDDLPESDLVEEADYFFYLKTEIKTLVTASKILNIDLSNIDTSGVASKVKTLNDEYEDDTTKSKLDVIYNSVIIRYILADKLDDELKPSTINQDVRDSDTVKADDGIYDNTTLIKYYKKYEIKSLIYVLNELDIDLDNFDTDAISNQIQTFNNDSAVKPTETKLDLMYESTIVKYIIALKLDNTLDPSTINHDVRDSNLVKDTDGIQDSALGVDVLYYQINEVKSLIDILNELELDINDFNTDSIPGMVKDFNKESTERPGETKLTLLYESVMIKYMIADKVDNNIDATTINLAIRDSDAVKSNDGITNDSNEIIRYYHKQELEALIYALNELELDLEEFDTTNIGNDLNDYNNPSTAKPTESRLELLYESVMIRYIIADKLDEYIDDEAINLYVRDSEYVKANDSIYDESNKLFLYYQIEEVRYLIISANELEININSITPVAIKNKMAILNDEASSDSSITKLNVLYNSILVKYMISKSLDDTLDETIINQAVKNDEIIRLTDNIMDLDVNNKIYYYQQLEVKSLIDGINELDIDPETFDTSNVSNIDTFNDPSTINPEVDKLTVLYESIILKYIIAKKLDDTLTADVINVNVRDSFIVKETDGIIDDGKDVLFYQPTEIYNLASATKELHINTETFDTSNVNSELVNLNKQSTVDTSNTKLDVIYRSVIIKYIIADKLDTNLNGKVNDSVLNYEAIRNNDSIYDEEVLIQYYEKLEVKSLINALIDLNIDTETFDTSNVNAEIKTLNDATTIDEYDGSSKLDVIYLSVIMRYLVADNLDSALTSEIVNVNVRDSLNKAKNTDNIIDNNTSKVLLYYSLNEMEALINATIELDIDTETFDTSGITSMISTLTGASTINPSSTKLDELYESIIMKYIIADKLDNIFDSTVVKIAVRDSEKTKANDSIYDNEDLLLYYLVEEVKALINSANEMNIEFTDASFDSSEITNNFTTLNLAATSDSSITKLDVLYGSVIIKYIIADNIDNTLTADIIKTSIRDSEAVKDYANTILDTDGITELYYYFEAEVSALINSLIDLNVNLDTFDENEISNNVINLNDESEVTGMNCTKLEVLYNSIITKYIIASELDANLTEEVIATEIKNCIEVKPDFITATDGVDEYYYQMNEVAYLVYALKDLGLTNISDFTAVSDSVLTLNEESVSFPGNTKLATLYYARLTWHMVKKSVADAIDTEVREETFNYLLVLDTNITSIDAYAYTFNEIEYLIDGINSLGITSLDEIADLDISNRLTTIDLDKLFDSTITWDIVTVKFHEILVDSENALIDHQNAKYDRIYNDLAMFYLKSELKAIQDLLIKSGYDDATDIAINQLTIDDEGIQIITSSHILLASISDYMILSEDIYVPSVSFDRTNNNNYIYATEIELVLRAISEGMVDEYGNPATIETLEEGNMKPNQITDVDKVNASIIMRASMTKHVKTVGTDSFVAHDEAYVTVEKQFEYDKTESEMTQLLVLTGDEISHILTALDIYSGGESFEIEITYTKLLSLTTSDLAKVIDSNLLCNLFADYILTEPILPSYGYENYRTVESSFNYEIDSIAYTYEFDQVSELQYRFKPSFVVECWNLEANELVNINTLEKTDVVVYVAYLKDKGITA